MTRCPPPRGCARAVCRRWLDDVLIWLKVALPTCSVQALELVYNALPFLGTGFRLNEVRLARRRRRAMQAAPGRCHRGAVWGARCA